jgi:dihydroorotase
MPNNRPPVATVEALRLKQSCAARGAYVNYGLFGLIVQDNLDQLTALAQHGVIGFKCYMGETVGKIPAPDDGVMLEAFETIAKLGHRIAVHAENNAIMQRKIAQLKAAGRTDPLAHVESRPDICEIEAVGRAIAFAEWAGARLHICHEGSSHVLPLIRAAKARGLDVTVETCPHYLLLTAEEMPRLGSVLRMNPPVRAPGHQEALWQALYDGTIDVLATDHSPHTIEEKTRPNIWEAISGFPGVETAMPLMLTEVTRGRIALNQYVKWASENQAKAWGLYPRKGVLMVGSDADIAIVDLNRESVIDARALHSKCKLTPFDGTKVKGLPVCTIVRGQVVMKDGNIVASPGLGRPVTSSFVQKTTSA